MMEERKNTQFTLQFSQSREIQNRVYRVYEEGQLVLQTTQVQELNGLSLSNDAAIKIIVEPEIVGVKLVLLLFLQLLTSTFDATLFASLFQDCIVLNNHSSSNIDIDYRYSFKESFRSKVLTEAQQFKEITIERFFEIVMIVVLPISLILLYCIFHLALGMEELLLRAVCFVILCGLECYLGFVVYRLSKFIRK